MNDNRGNNRNGRDSEFLGWLYILLVIGTPAIIVLGIVFGIGHTEWGARLLAKVFWWGIGLVTLLAMMGVNPLDGGGK